MNARRAPAAALAPPRSTLSVLRVALLAACLSLVPAVAMPGHAAAAPPEVHGSADAFAAPGVALAWAVLRGTSEATTIVVLRIVTDPGVYPRVAIAGSNPFSQGRQSVQPGTEIAGGIDVRVPRAHFAEFPRTELRFYDSAAAMEADTPQLIVFYLGVPDTTPEFMTQAALDADVANRIARARASGSNAK